VQSKPLLIVSLLALTALSEAQGQQTFVGTITDDMCAKDGHESMRMGPNDAECTKACISAHGAEYVLADGKTVYTLSDQKTPEKFAGQRVRVTGTLNAKTHQIHVQSMAPAT
jgi:phage terminase large subunit